MNLSLIRICISSLKDLAEFIKVSDKGLQEPVEEGDYNGLVECMGHLIAVKDRQATTDEMFEPLKHTIELLRQYGQELPEEVHQQLQVNGVCEGAAARVCFIVYILLQGLFSMILCILKYKEQQPTHGS